MGATAQQPAFTKGYARIGPLKMYYEIHGKGQPLVLIHGGGSTIGTSFGHILPAFAQHRQVIAVELQAHGHTADVDRPLSFRQDADDVAALLRQLHIEKADILGFSNGGQTALEIAIRHPGLVRKLVLACTFYKRDGAYSWLWDGFPHASLDNMPKYLRDAYLGIDHNDSAGLEKMFHRDVQRMIDFKDWPDDSIRAIQSPALVMIADQDVTRPEHAVEMYRTLPHARLIVLPGHHGEFLEKGGPLTMCAAAMIDQFLDEQ
jgi:pimeloyl-ACP methyl ester carboxylesterase